MRSWSTYDWLNVDTAWQRISYEILLHFAPFEISEFYIVYGLKKIAAMGHWFTKMKPIQMETTVLFEQKLD